MNGIFLEQANSFQSGQKILKTCEGIISAYILDGGNADDPFIIIFKPEILKSLVQLFLAK